MSLVEVMIAAFVLSVALLALASTAITSIVSLRVSRARQEATDAASAMIEDLRRADYSSIALASSAVPPGSCDADYDEPIVTTDLPGAIPQVQPFGPSGKVTVTTSVSWYDEDDPDGCTHTHRRSKRVRVVASWEDSGKSYSVEESTVVAPVDRGLPAPDFRLGTPTVTVSFTPSELGQEKCVGHAIRNLGAEDGYDWTANRTDAGSVYKPSGGSEYTTQGGKVRMRAFLEHPIADPPLDPAPHMVPSQGQRHTNMPDDLQLLVDGDANARPETDPNAKLATGDQARLWICYLPDASLTPSTAPIATLALTVRSQFDPNRKETVEHTLRITKEALTFHLYDDDTSSTGASGPRVITTSGNTEALPVQVMGPETSLQPRKLGSGSLPNFDTDFDGLPGLRLADGPRPAVSGDVNWAASTVAFHQQVTPGVTFEPTVRLRLHTASESALTMTEVPPKTLRYRVRLQVLAKNERTVQSTPLDATIAYTHTSGGFVEVAPPDFLLASPLTLQNEQFLRLEITCLSTSEDICHLAYDNTAHPSRLGLVQQ